MRIQASLFFILDFIKKTVVENLPLMALYPDLDYVPPEFKTHNKLIFELLTPKRWNFINEGVYNY